MKDRQAFLEERQTGIGGSDVHHLLNEKPWGCSRLLWYEKTDYPPDYERVETDAMKRGTRLEEIAAEVYQEETGRNFRRQGIKRKKGTPFLFVHMDRQLFTTAQHLEVSTATSVANGPGVLEIKVPGQYAFRNIQRDGLPTAYYLQLQFSLLVTGYNWGSFAIFWADGWKLLWWDVERDQKLVDTLEENAILFWEENIQGDQIPPRLEPNDPRCGRCPYRGSCQGEKLKALIKDSKEARIETDFSIREAVETYQKMKDLKAEASALYDTAQADLKTLLGDRTAVETPGFRCYYRPQVSNRVDTKALKKEKPEIWKEFVKESISRPLRVYSI